MMLCRESAFVLVEVLCVAWALGSCKWCSLVFLCNRLRRCTVCFPEQQSLVCYLPDVEALTDPSALDPEVVARVVALLPPKGREAFNMCVCSPSTLLLSA